MMSTWLQDRFFIFSARAHHRIQGFVLDRMTRRFTTHRTRIETDAFMTRRHPPPKTNGKASHRTFRHVLFPKRPCCTTRSWTFDRACAKVLRRVDTALRSYDRFIYDDATLIVRDVASNEYEDQKVMESLEEIPEIDHETEDTDGDGSSSTSSSSSASAAGSSNGSSDAGLPAGARPIEKGASL